MLVLNFLWGHMADVIITVTALLLLAFITRWLHNRPVIAQAAWPRVAVITSALAVGGLVIVNLALRSARVSLYLGAGYGYWISFISLSVVLAVSLIGPTIAIARFIPAVRADHKPGRRRFLLAARGAVLATPVAAAGYAVFVQRSDLRAREVDLPIAGLPKELEGLRLVQLSDIHLSPFLSESDLARAIDMANEYRPHLALVTGDLITTARDPLDRAIEQIARLKADAGVVGCLGNHEVYAHAEDYVERHAARRGVDILRSRSRVFTFDGKPLNVAGVDYQRMKTQYLVDAGKLVRPGMPNILLSHNPDVFPVSAAMGFDATISGHTHGGQISVEILQQNVSVARFYTPYVYGLYREGKSSIYVTRGIGTVGVPARLGAPPEIALIRLCAT